VCDERTRRVGVVVVTDVMGDGGVPTRGERRARGEQAAAADPIAYRQGGHTHERWSDLSTGERSSSNKSRGLIHLMKTRLIMDNRDYP
jgi:hypothetical protein